MRLISTWIFLIGAPLLGQYSVSRVPFTEARGAVRSFTPAGAIFLPAQAIDLELRFPSGEREQGAIVVVYDQTTKRFLADYFATLPALDALEAVQNERTALYSDVDGIAEWTMFYEIHVREHAGKADSLSAAQDAAIDTVRRAITGFKGKYHDQLARAIPTYKVLDRGFSCHPYGHPEFTNTCLDHKTRILSLSRDAGQWKLEASNLWTEEIILDPNFKILSARQVPPENK